MSRATGHVVALSVWIAVVAGYLGIPLHCVNAQGPAGPGLLLERGRVAGDKQPKEDAPPGPAGVDPGAGARKRDRPGALTLPASIGPWESIRVFARVAGPLKSQTVDIGDRVKRGQVLAVLDTPELAAQLEHEKAVVDQARLRVTRAKASAKVARADLETGRLAVTQAEAELKAAARRAESRAKQWQRLKALANTKAVDERLLDESQSQHLAAQDAEGAAQVALAKARAQLAADTARIELAEADVREMEAAVALALTALEKVRVQLSFATILAPIDGSITQRGYFVGEMVRPFDEVRPDAPMFTLQRTDRLRVQVQVPDQDVPYVNVGDAAVLTIDGLPGKQWSSKVARMAGKVDAKARHMTVELDLPNPGRELSPGMHGKVTIQLGQRGDGEK